MKLKNLLNSISRAFFENPHAQFTPGELRNNFISQYLKGQRLDRWLFLSEFSNLHGKHYQNISKKISNTQFSEDDNLKKTYSLCNIVKPPCHSFFQSFGRVPNGVKCLMDFRCDVLDLISKIKKGKAIVDSSETSIFDADADSLRFIDQDLKDLLSTWFSSNILELKRLTWESPSSLLQKVAEYEAVHPVRNWKDMKRRVGSYRRSFIYIHPSMPGVPLVILHTALSHDIVNSMDKLTLKDKNLSELEIDDLENEEELKKRNAVIFYSISSPHKGLKGIDLGNSLIKDVANALQSELPDLQMFSTLSPIPGFRDWLHNELDRTSCNRLIPPSQHFLHLLEDLKIGFQAYDSLKVVDLIKEKLNDFRSNIDCPHVKNFLMKSCCHYLLNERYRGQSLNSVANFHLSNGAMIWRINWNADVSPRILTQSYGIMVNYRYFIEQVDKYSEKYIEENVIQASEEVRNMLDSRHKL